MRPLNKILSAYKTRDDYEEILKYAAKIHHSHKKNKTYSEKQLLRIIEAEFGEPLELFTPDMFTGRILYPFGSELIDPLAVSEMHEVLRLPPAKYGALMPDAHASGIPGLMPVGGVLLTEEAVVPSAVGYDISCQVQLVITDLPVEDFEERRESIAESVRKVTRFGRGASFEDGKKNQHAVMDRKEWDHPALAASSYKDLAYNQLGSSGSGNHFVDMVIVDDLAVDLGPDVTRDGGPYVGILSHSGSRGPGYKIADFYIKYAAKWMESRTQGYRKGMGYLPLNTEAGSAYWLDMTLMGHYADANHEVIADNILKEIGAEALQLIRSRHNFAFLDLSNLNVITRKGATPAAQGQLGLLPGSSGTYSYITRGLGNISSLRSSAHGAGRPWGRRKAKEIHNQDVFEKFMDNFDVLYYGVASDETPFAYKNIEEVVDAQEGVLTDVVARMTPRIVIMGAS